jgi:hypothetical protein
MLAGIASFGTVAIGSVWLIRGQNTGQTIGTIAMTCTWTTTVMDIICTTADIPVIALPLAST